MRDVDCLAVPPFPRTPEPDSQICFNTVLAVARSHGARNIPAKGGFFCFCFFQPFPPQESLCPLLFKFGHRPGLTLGWASAGAEVPLC